MAITLSYGVTAYDSRVLLQFLQVMHRLKPPAALFTPPMVTRVLAHRLGRRPETASRQATVRPIGSTPTGGLAETAH